MPKMALDAAPSLFSYRSSQPPAGEEPSGKDPPKVVTLGSLFDVAFESHGVLELHRELRSGNRVWNRP